MTELLANILAQHKSKGYVTAPAGYGKTYLIAAAVKASVESRPQLILTHTYAGVDSIRKKMQDMDVPSAKYNVDTIASWSLRFCLNYPSTTNWNNTAPTNKEWAQLYVACGTLLNRPFALHIVRSSYAGLYVDEYQDCSAQQHFLIDSLAQQLPCRLLGDPMQAIFGFADNPVDWGLSVYPHYKKLGELQIPWRWNEAGSKELGAWLDDVRNRLQAGEKISLHGQLPKGIKVEKVDIDDHKNSSRLNLFYRAKREKGSVIAIRSGDPRSKHMNHSLARMLGGTFSSIEEVEGKDLSSFINKLEKQPTQKERLLLAIEFSIKCFTKINNVLSAATKRGEYSKQTKATKHPDVLNAANLYLEDSSPTNLKNLFNTIGATPETAPYRRDLLNRLIAVLNLNIDHPDLNLKETLQRFQSEFRHSGRPLALNKLIGTTLLVKGLEFDHAIIINADKMAPKDLYVALTRGAKTITITSSKLDIPA